MRNLTKDDLIRAQIPELYWGNKLKNIPDSVSYKARIKNYMAKIDEMMSRGIGLYLWSPENSTGKTTISTIIGKHAMKCGYTVLFIPSFNLIRSTFDKTPFDETGTLFQRAHDVNLLIIDDADKEYKDAKGYSDNIIENVIRARNQKKRATIMTSNLHPKDLKNVYSKSFSELLRECVIAIEIFGKDKGGLNWRAMKEKELRDLI